MASKGGLKQVKKYALGDDDLRKLLGQDIKILSYPQLKTMGSIDEAFDSKGRSIILFPNASPTMGHWCCMIRRPSRIDFFDPYGEAPEEQKDGLSQSRLEALDLSHPYLTQLFRQSGLPIYYNNHAFQTDRADVATCGRHCAVRMFYAPFSLQKYKKVMDGSGMSPDDFVSAITYDKIGK